MKFDTYLRYAQQIIGTYTGDIPLPHWLNQFFKARRQMGSRDRRQVADLLFSYYRVARALNDLSIEDKLLAGLWLCMSEPCEMLQHFKPHWFAQTGLSAQQKFGQLGTRHHLSDLFPWKKELSLGIQEDCLAESMLEQPDLFLRIRPAYELTVEHKLESLDWRYQKMSSHCIRLSSGRDLGRYFELNREIVVQDLNSQRASEIIRKVWEREMTPKQPLQIWDCCAGSGGKAIYVHDLFPSASLIVSDIRESILRNLDKRLNEAGIKNYRRFKADLTQQEIVPAEVDQVDLLIADVPCSGSGTWSRNPENLFFFDPSQIQQYQSTQQKILLSTLVKLKPGGLLVYITCSVFAKENEDMIEFLEKSGLVRCIEKQWLTGYGQKADSLFAAAFKSPG